MIKSPPRFWDWLRLGLLDMTEICGCQDRDSSLYGVCMCLKQISSLSVPECLFPRGEARYMNTKQPQRFADEPQVCVLSSQVAKPYR